MQDPKQLYLFNEMEYDDMDADAKVESHENINKLLRLLGEM